MRVVIETCLALGNDPHEPAPDQKSSRSERWR